jgi:hypothetical protein
MTLKDLRDKKRRLEDEARGKLASITADTTQETQRQIEQDHSDLLAKIAAVSDEIARAERDAEDEGDERKGRSKRKRKARAKADDGDGDDEDGDDDDDDDSTDAEGDDDDDDGDGKRKKRKRALKKPAQGKEDKDDGDEDRSVPSLSKRQMSDLVAIDTQARGLGFNLDLAGALTRNETPDAMRKRLFEQLSKRSSQTGPRGSAIVIRDEHEGRAEAMELALIQRVLASRGGSGIMEYKPKSEAHQQFVQLHGERAREYRGMGFAEIAAECLGFRGNIRTPQAAYDLITRAFESTSDYPSIFLNVLNKSLLARYELHTPTYREIAIERPFNDFRPHPQIRAGEFPALQQVSETGEILYGKSADLNESVSVVPYGVVFTISRQMLVNDDLGAIDQILGSAGDTVLVFENNTFFTMFNSNPVLNQDSTAVFAAGHNNLVASGSGAAPAVTTIGSARQALRAMKSITGLYLNVPPRIILTGPAQETAADQMVTAITPTLTTSVNPFSGRLRSVSDANITTSQWYLMTEPGRVPCFVYGFLNGAAGPRVRTFEPFGVQGVKVSLEHDFGCGAIDYRGCYQNYGS